MAERDQAAAALASAAMQAHDWDSLRLLLHPYLHWTQPDGTVVRGRSRVLALLRQELPDKPPRVAELRDQQIYRWESR